MSDQAKHTPGPWTVDIDMRAGGAIQIIDANDLTICFMSVSGDEDHDADNANLIAAAPELFAACAVLESFSKRVLDYAVRNPKQVLYNDEIVAQSHSIVNALAKARGANA